MILIDDGAIHCEVTDIMEHSVRTQVKNDGIVRENRPIHLPNAHIEVKTISELDDSDI
jgi:pyruvate kinase